jgi:SAM-dependent methyltransferase
MESDPMVKEVDSKTSLMKDDWNDRARVNAKWYITTIRLDLTDEDFDASGRPEVEKFILGDPLLTGPRVGRDLKSQRMLEIGCGLGRMSRHLAEYFGEVHGTDVSGEMIRQARERLAGISNLSFFETSGADFTALPPDHYDLVFSVYVFQHVPWREVVESNISDACRVLRPGGLFKFQVNNVSHPDYVGREKNTWEGTTLTENDLRRAARNNGMRLVSLSGLGTQYCWAIFNKPLAQLATLPGQTAQPRVEFFSQSASPLRREVPVSGHLAWLTVIVSGLDHRIVDANSVVVELGDDDLRPCYVGWLGDEFAAEMRSQGWEETESLTQINVGIPEGLSPGEYGVRVRYLNQRATATASVRLQEALPDPPEITHVANDADGSLDLRVSGERAGFRIFTIGLDESAGPENVTILLDDLTLRPAEVTYLPSGAIYKVTARFPEGLAPGSHTVRVDFKGLVSEICRIEVHPVE